MPVPAHVSARCSDDIKEFVFGGGAALLVVFLVVICIPQRLKAGQVHELLQKKRAALEKDREYRLGLIEAKEKEEKRVAESFLTKSGSQQPVAPENPHSLSFVGRIAQLVAGDEPSDSRCHYHLANFFLLKPFVAHPLEILTGFERLQLVVNTLLFSFAALNLFHNVIGPLISNSVLQSVTKFLITTVLTKVWTTLAQKVAVYCSFKGSFRGRFAMHKRAVPPFCMMLFVVCMVVIEVFVLFGDESCDAVWDNRFIPFVYFVGFSRLIYPGLISSFVMYDVAKKYGKKVDHRARLDEIIQRRFDIFKENMQYHNHGTETVLDESAREPLLS